MKHLKRFTLTFVSNFIFFVFVFWIASLYLFDNFPIQFPEFGFFTCLSWIILTTIVSLTNKKVVLEISTDKKYNNPYFFRIAWFFYGMGVIIIVISLVRFGLPLLPSVDNDFIPQQVGGNMIMWFMIIVMGSTFHRFGAFILKTGNKDLTSWIRSKFILPNAEEILSNDSRPPVLYLRSFDRELEKSRYYERFGKYSREGVYLFSTEPGRKYHPREIFRLHFLGSTRSDSDEQMIFADFFNRIGPYISIARPGEVFQNMDLGAAKKTVTDEEWKAEVLRLLPQCSIILLEAGDSEGLSWEIKQVIKYINPNKFLLLLPSKDEVYEEFRLRTIDIFPSALPEKKVPSRLLMFDSFWQPVELEQVNLCLGQTLQPFLEKNGIDFK